MRGGDCSELDKKYEKNTKDHVRLRGTRTQEWTQNEKNFKNSRMKCTGSKKAIIFYPS